MPSLRRALPIGLVLAAAMARAEIPADGGWPAVPVVDVHTHVFNARDLPLKGIFNKYGAKAPYDQILSNICAALTAPDDMPLLTDLRVIVARVQNPVIRLNDEARRRLQEFLVARGAPPFQLQEIPGADPDALLLAQVFRQLQFPSPEKIHALAGEPPIAGYLRFVGIMLQDHDTIRRYLAEDAYPRVDLFVHHLMDLDAAYAGHSVNPFSQQVRQAQRLDAKYGKFVSFVAFDPFRRQDALPLVKAAVQAGALGIKFYPPTGYRASGNFFPPAPADPDRLERWKARYAGWSPGELDAVSEAMFAWAEDASVPIFTHCELSAFEADLDYGLRSDPFYWRTVLSHHPRLRVCFGHAGGEEYWFSDPAHDRDHDAHPPPVDIGQHDEKDPKADTWWFGAQVVDLCLTFPNVYCEVGYLDPILEGKGEEALGRRLGATLPLASKTGDWRFGDRLMYGTDWHMIHKEAGYRGFLAACDRVIRQVDSGAWRERFFAGNAISFLGLREQSTKPEHAAQRAAWEEVIAAVDHRPLPRRPIYVIGHDPNTAGEAEQYLQEGANAVEPDINTLADRTTLVVGHGPKLWTGPARAGSPTIEQYFTDLHRLARKYPGFCVVYLDCKPYAAAGPELATRLQDAIDHDLLGPPGDRINLRVLVSLDRMKRAMPTGFFAALGGRLAPGESLTFDQEGDPAAVAAALASVGVTHDAWYSRGTSVLRSLVDCGLRPSVERALELRRENQSFGQVLTWTVNSQDLQREYLKCGVDGFIVDRRGSWYNSGSGLRNLCELLRDEGAALRVRPATREPSAAPPAD